MNKFNIHKIFGAISMILLLGCSQVPEKASGSAKSVNFPESKIEKAFISFRIGVPLWTSEKRSNELLDLFDKYKGVTDEITFFTSETHAPLPLDVFRQRTIILKDRMAQARKGGTK